MEQRCAEGCSNGNGNAGVRINRGNNDRRRHRVPRKPADKGGSDRRKPSNVKPRGGNKVNKPDIVIQDVNQTVNAGRGRRGAPSRKTPELIERILAGIADGKSTRAVCNEVGIGQRTVWDWLASDREFSQQYARAKMFCADCLADEIIEIADDSSRDTYTDRSGRRVINHEVIAQAKLRIDARKWYASKLMPKKYRKG